MRWMQCRWMLYSSIWVSNADHIELPTSTIVIFFLWTAEGNYREIDRNDINVTNRLGIGEFGPLLDAEVKLDVNDVQRAMIKVSRISRISFLNTICRGFNCWMTCLIIV